ncbi:hypothetical protein OC845_002305 [Tilletia horrida]|nr:hypothetical protein OC845_002305 [Tilletia horrida]
MTSTHPFPTAHHPAQALADHSFDISNASQEPTRTIAILTHSAAKVHRLAITSRITAAGFHILAERLETWETPGDDDFLSAFLACEADEKKWALTLTGAPIYVMLLERKRAPQTWLELLGPENPAEQLDEDGLPLANSTKSLRGTYGTSKFYGSPVSGAEHQIAIAFPEYATTEALHNLGLQSPVDNQGVEYIDSHNVVYDEHGHAYDARTGEELDLQVAYDEDQDEDNNSAQAQYQGHGAHDMDRTQGSHTVYRALRLPKTHLKPDIEPRLSKAAALRMGIELPSVPRSSQNRTTSDASDASKKSNQAPMGISGVPLTDKPLPKSLSRPSIAPRLNKAAAARLGQAPPEMGTNGAAANGGKADGSGASARPRQAVDYSNTPGHKRNLTPSGLASLQKPSIAPRLNKSAAARITSGASSTGSTASVTSPTLSSTPSSSSLHSSAPSSAHRTFSGSSMTSTGSASEATAGPSGGAPRVRQATDYSSTPGHKRTSVPGMAKVASLAAPSIAPRVNKAAAARMGGADSQPLGPGSGTASGPGGGGGGGGGHGRTSSMSVSGSNAQREKKPVDYSNTPGHRRASLSLAVASLAPPTILPRSNNAAEARLAADKVREAEAAAAAAAGNKVRRPSSSAGSRPGSSLGSNHNNQSSRPGSALGSAGTGPGHAGSRPTKVKGAPPPSSYRMASVQY